MAGASGIPSWSTTPATNATADGGASNWAENQAPSTVNNSMRQDMADIRAFANDLIWYAYGNGDQASGSTYLGVPTLYSSATAFTVAGGIDVTSVYHANRRVKAVGVSTGTIYGSISSSSFSTPTNTINITWDSGSLSNETLVIYLSQTPVTGSPVPAAAFAGTLAAANGGTGISSYAVGDLLYASATTTLSKLADVATGNALISGGVTTAPSWGKIALTTHVSGILSGANGGTGVANTGLTITLAGNLVTTGAFNTTFAQAATTTVTLPSTSATMARTDAGQTFTGTQAFGVLTATGGTHTGLTSLGIRSTGAAFDLTLASTEVFTAGRTLTVTLGDAARTLTLSGSPTISGITTTGTGTLALGTKTLTISNTLTLSGTDSTVMTFPSTSATIARTDAANTFTGVQTMTSPAITTPAFTGASTGTWTVGGTVTINAFALAGTVSGGGNQLNNVVIGTTTPLAGSFTTVVGTTGAFSSTLTSTAHTITSASATALTVGLNGATNPAFTVDSSTGSQAAGFKITGAATGGTVALVATDSGSNTSVTFNAKGSGTIGIGSVSTGAVTIAPVLLAGGGINSTGAIIATSTSANALSAGRQGSISPQFNVDASVASVATGLNVIGAAAGGGLAVAVISSGTNEALTLNAKGSGTIGIGSVSTGAVTITPTLTLGASITAHSGTAIPAGGTAGAGLLVSSTTNFGVFFGSGAPSLAAAKGSLYLRSDGSSSSTRMYVNSDGSTTWVAVTTAS